MVSGGPLATTLAPQKLCSLKTATQFPVALNGPMVVPALSTDRLPANDSSTPGRTVQATEAQAGSNLAGPTFLVVHGAISKSRTDPGLLTGLKVSGVSA